VKLRLRCTPSERSALKGYGGSPYVRGVCLAYARAPR